MEKRFEEMNSAAEDNTIGLDIEFIEQGITVDNLSYKYPNTTTPALKKISFRIKRKEMIGLVGPSGSGKSTIIDLLSRLRSPSDGGIFIDDINYLEYSLKSLRDLISYAPQSPQLFDGTIEEHIAYGGGSSVSSEDIRFAANLSGADEFIDKLPNKYQSYTGSDGINLSGGQRQRLDLARALFTKSPLLLLDEPTGNLDAKSELKFKEAIQRIREETDTTIIIVTHQISNVIDADQIIVLNNGEIENIGRHSELIRSGGWYSEAWKIQSSR
jgi:ABC-type multidrug transport system fused ATPase/permease subunit